MTCQTEVSQIKETLAQVPDLAQIDIDLPRRRLRITYDASQTGSEELVRILRKSGFAAKLAQKEHAWWDSTRTALASAMLGGVCWISALLIHLCLPETPPVVATVLLDCAILLGGIPLAEGLILAIIARKIDMHLLMGVGVVGAVALGDLWEAAATVSLFSLAVWLESYVSQRAMQATRGLAALTPNTARVLRNGVWEEVSPESVRPGESVMVRSGEVVPLDGVVREGVGFVNQAALTGESLPVEKRPGSLVYAGSLNSRGTMRVEVLRDSDDSMVARIQKLVAEAQARPTRFERLVDRFARYYTPTVIVVALAVALLGVVINSTGFPTRWATMDWIYFSLIVVVTGCPCALVLSGPLTAASGLFAAARRGLLVKGGEYLEAAAAITTVAFDKTGTLTIGSPTVHQVHALNGYSDHEVLALAAALEQWTDHPLASSILAEARRRDLPLPPASDVEFLEGRGIVGTVAKQKVFVGNDRLAHKMLATTSLALPGVASSSASSLVFVGSDTTLLGVVELIDPPKEDARKAIDELRQLGVNDVVVLSGDRNSVVRELAENLGITEYYGELLPEDKLRLVRQWEEEGKRVAFVGDGVNDGPALAAATLGITLGKDVTDLALDTARVVSISPELSQVARLVDVARKTTRILRTNLWLALAIKATVLVAAVFGLGALWMAVAADVGSTLVVAANGLRILLWPLQK